jgi:protoheme IX farnesyltransferase
MTSPGSAPLRFEALPISGSMTLPTASAASPKADPLPATAGMEVLRSTVWRDYFVLAKPRITLMILLTVGVAMVVACRKLEVTASPLVWLSALVGTAMVAASASVLNQWYERDRDSMMQRTRKRPLPSGRLTTFEAFVFGCLLVIAGIVVLGLGANWLSASISGLTWFIYCWVYTPMKTKSWWNTAVGTLPGALPVMIGWTAVGGGVWDLSGWLLTSVVILWQFPHFMAIAWLYKDQYTQAGFRMLTREDPTGLAAAWHAVVPALALVPVSMWVMSPSTMASLFMAMLGAIIALSQVIPSIQFFRRRDDATARTLLRASLVYLPMILLLAVARWVLL